MILYNEIDTYAAQWTRNLIQIGAIADGCVDTRSIKEITPEDLAGYDRVHCFSGIAGWQLAWQQSGWDDPNVSVWTGSCPCQPYSVAGKQQGNEDERDLWPDFFRLIKAGKPGIVCGEQVASAIGFGWLDRICADLEAEGYQVWATVLGAHSVGAPHIRQRLYWGGASIGGLGNGIKSRLEGQSWNVDNRSESRRLSAIASGPTPKAGAVGNFWSEYETVECTDGKSRRVISSSQLLDDGIPADMAILCTSGSFKKRKDILKGIGNAICVPLAVEFIRAFMGARQQILEDHAT